MKVEGKVHIFGVYNLGLLYPAEGFAEVEGLACGPEEVRKV